MRLPREIEARGFNNRADAATGGRTPVARLAKPASDPAVQIIARGPRAEAQAAAVALDSDPLLESATYSIIEEDEELGLWRIDAYPTSRAEAEALRGKLAAFAGLKVATETLADADWLAMALSGLPPVRAGRFFVFGAHDLGRVPANAVKLRIEAGAAFGTGHHATTAGCLEALHGLLKARRFGRVLDVGAGSGILAIAAARTGSGLVRGADIDPASVRTARDNARINGVRARFVLADGLADAALRAAAPYDLVFANILAAPLKRLALGIRMALKPGARAVLSGILRRQSRSVQAAYRAKGFVLERRIQREAWTILILRRS